MDPYVRYYMEQVGGGGSLDVDDIGTVYRSSSIHRQRGRGIGTFFRGIYRFVRPLFTNERVQAAGKELLKSGGQILTEIAENPQNRSVGDISLSALKEGGLRAASKLMTGRGRRRVVTRKRKAPSKALKRKARSKASQSKRRKLGKRKVVVRKRKVARKTKPKRRLLDCFSK